MKRYFALFLFLIPFYSCNDIDNFINGKKTSSKKISYSYKCIDSAVSGGKFNRDFEKATDFVRDVAVSERSISDESQTEYGKMFHEQMIKEGEFKLLNDPALVSKLNVVMKELLDAREEPSKISYQIYALNDTNINAFTFGGRIYVTKAMIDKCNEDKELIYSIIGHEIGHNECGHIRSSIQGMMLSDKLFGKDYGNTAFALTRFLTASFNQRKELEADYYGINLSNTLNHDVCTAVNFWKEMARKENRYNEVEDFFPRAAVANFRAQCLMDHIATNFDKDCGGLNRNNLLPEVVSK